MKKISFFIVFCCMFFSNVCSADLDTSLYDSNANDFYKILEKRASVYYNMQGSPKLIFFPLERKSDLDDYVYNLKAWISLYGNDEFAGFITFYVKQSGYLSYIILNMKKYDFNTYITTMLILTESLGMTEKETRKIPTPSIIDNKIWSEKNQKWINFHFTKNNQVVITASGVRTKSWTPKGVNYVYERKKGKSP